MKTGSSVAKVKMKFLRRFGHLGFCRHAFELQATSYIVASTVERWCTRCKYWEVAGDEYKIIDTLRENYTDEEIHEWLMTPHKMLARKSPFTALQGGEGFFVKCALDCQGWKI